MRRSLSEFTKVKLKFFAFHNHFNVSFSKPTASIGSNHTMEGNMRPLDEKLVQQTLAGDAESFSELVRKYQGAVQGLAYHLVGSFEDAEDLVQEAFVTAYLKLHQLRQPEKFAMWIRQITRNCCMMWLRSRRENVSIDEATADCYVDRQVLSRVSRNRRCRTTNRL